MKNVAENIKYLDKRTYRVLDYLYTRKVLYRDIFRIPIVLNTRHTIIDTFYFLYRYEIG